MGMFSFPCAAYARNAPRTADTLSWKIGANSGRSCGQLYIKALTGSKAAEDQGRSGTHVAEEGRHGVTLGGGGLQKRPSSDVADSHSSFA